MPAPCAGIFHAAYAVCCALIQVFPILVDKFKIKQTIIENLVGSPLSEASR
jgi:hypothetical protein